MPCLDGPCLGNASGAGKRRQNLVDAEDDLLRWGISWTDDWNEIPQAQRPSCCFTVEDVPISAESTIHEVRYFGGLDTESARVNEVGLPLVLTHGWAAGASIFTTSAPTMRASWKGPVIALDWFGCGLSSRPVWRFGRSSEQEAVDFFVEPLERWRAARGYDRIVLVGHSLGGFLSGCYAAKYPQRVERLVLASSAGLFGEAQLGCVAKTLVSTIFRSLITAAQTYHGARFIARKYFSLFGDVSWLPREQQIHYHATSWSMTTSSGLNGAAVISSDMDPLCERLKVFQGGSKHGRTPAVILVNGGDEDPAKPKGDVFIEHLAQFGVRVDQLEVARGGHTMQTANPIGFAHAVVATCGDTRHKLFGVESLAREAANKAGTPTG